MNNKINYRNIITILNGNSNLFYIGISCNFLPDNLSTKLPSCPKNLG
jgi:hypothetical protein